jgi:hypothetical protein
MDRIEFLELSEEQLTMVAGGNIHQGNYASNHQYSSVRGSAEGGNGNGNHSPDVTFAGRDGYAGYNANGNGGSLSAGNSNQTAQSNNILIV